MKDETNNTSSQQTEVSMAKPQVIKKKIRTLKSGRYAGRKVYVRTVRRSDGSVIEIPVLIRGQA